MPDQRTVLVTGASGLLGRLIVAALAQSDDQVIALARGHCPDHLLKFCDWRSMDIESARVNFTADVLIHVAPLWLLPEFVKTNAKQLGLKRCIAFSSTSVEAKIKAADADDRQLAGLLQQAEHRLAEASGNTIDYTIFRPTLIYGYGQDKNISTIAKFINKLGFFPVAGRAEGLRQPVHVDDLVNAALAVIDNPKTYAKTYNLTGGETLSYSQMVAKIFKGLNRPVRLLHIPVWIYRLLLKLKSSYGSGAASRMSQDLSFSSQTAIDDFDYQAQAFLLDPQRDLPK